MLELVWTATKTDDNLAKDSADSTDKGDASVDSHGNRSVGGKVVAAVKAEALKKAAEVHNVRIIACPWLAYSASTGARFMLRRIGEPKGRTCTLARWDTNTKRWIVRLDNSDSAEEFVHLRPEEVLPIDAPQYEPDTRLMLVQRFESGVAVGRKVSPSGSVSSHNRSTPVMQLHHILVDAVVIQRFDPTLGSRHEIRLLHSNSSHEASYSLQPTRSEFCTLDSHAPTLPKEEREERDHWREKHGVVELDLNGLNHAIERFTSVYEYERIRVDFCMACEDANRIVEDQITARKMKIEQAEIMFEIDKTSGKLAPQDWKEWKEVGDLALLLLNESEDRTKGKHESQHLLVCAEPGTGKTWMLKQLVYLLSRELKQTHYHLKNGAPVLQAVPIVVPVQDIIGMLAEQDDEGLDSLVEKQGLMLWYLKNARHPEPRQAELLGAQATASPTSKMLLQAWETGAMIVLLDGIDEAAGQREALERFVHSELVLSGNRVVVTSRPTGITNWTLYKPYWVVANLQPMTAAMQRRWVEKQMEGNEHFVRLLSDVEDYSNIKKQTSKKQTFDESDRKHLETLDFLSRALKEPVILSLLTVIIEDGDFSRLPSSRHELYRSALRCRVVKSLEKLKVAEPTAQTTTSAVVEKQSSKAYSTAAAVRKGQAREGPMAQRNMAKSLAKKTSEQLFEEFSLSKEIISLDVSGSDYRSIVENNFTDWRSKCNGFQKGEKKLLGLQLKDHLIGLVQDIRQGFSSPPEVVSFEMLRSMATANQINGQRLFTSRDVINALGGRSEHLVAWLHFETGGGRKRITDFQPDGEREIDGSVPLVKVIEAQDSLKEHVNIRGMSPAEYQFVSVCNNRTTPCPLLFPLHCPLPCLNPCLLPCLIPCLLSCLLFCPLPCLTSSRGDEWYTKNVNLRSSCLQGHLSFQEGLYADHLLENIKHLNDNGKLWDKWCNDEEAMRFLNDRYMNNTCCIAAGSLGSLLAKQRRSWDFNAHKLETYGRQALWFITQRNDVLESLSLNRNDLGLADATGLGAALMGCTGLETLDLAHNQLGEFNAEGLRYFCRGLSTSSSLTDLKCVALPHELPELAH